MLLIVALIVLFLARDAMLQYLGPAQAAKRGAAPKTGMESASSDAGAPAPGNALDRARGMQELLQKESEKVGDH